MQLFSGNELILRENKSDAQMHCDLFRVHFCNRSYHVRSCVFRTPIGSQQLVFVRPFHLIFFRKPFFTFYKRAIASKFFLPKAISSFFHIRKRKKKVTKEESFLLALRSMKFSSFVTTKAIMRLILACGLMQKITDGNLSRERQEMPVF